MFLRILVGTLKFIYKIERVSQNFGLNFGWWRIWSAFLGNFGDDRSFINQLETIHLNLICKGLRVIWLSSRFSSVTFSLGSLDVSGIYGSRQLSLILLSYGGHFVLMPSSTP